MPQFEFECQDCGIRFTRLTTDRDMDIATCPECGGKSRRLMSVVNNVFGWRLTEASHDLVKRETIQQGKDKIERNV